ncbi:hypothetical protein BV325_02534 [Pseudomonas syringae pv. actinidiae]|nr:hypothetical protein BV361_05171 [Pseudomonas syringae pv. actinidiae]OSR61015.1 hypothetical protein BV325_02534 [Pseudomonas syringae pv. actinidiae]
MGFRTNTPHVQVGNFGIASLLNQLANFICNMIVGLIQQNSRSSAHQAPGPPCDHNCTHDTHGWIKPDPSEVAASKQGSDGKNRRQGIGNHMNVR